MEVTPVPHACSSDLLLYEEHGIQYLHQRRYCAFCSTKDMVYNICISDDIVPISALAAYIYVSGLSGLSLVMMGIALLFDTFPNGFLIGILY